ncbi:MAG: sugar phosphate isomerase/epimerase [Sphaerochaetaceae bacterium]|nr:sugar phosphate isomerase/epimerase [Sphaerochaetaceae bacterium]
MSFTKNVPDIGFRGHDFGKSASVEALAQSAKDALENSCIQFAPKKALATVPAALDKEWATECGKIFAEKNIRVAVLGCYINPVHPDEEKMEGELKRFENALSIAPCMNAPIVATETGSRNANNTHNEENWTEKTFSLFVNNLERLLKKAEENKTILAIEAVAYKNTIDNAERMLRVMEIFKHPNMRVLFDAVNILPVKGVDNIHSFYDETVSALAPYICALHVKDYVWQDEDKQITELPGPFKKGEIPVGEGLMPWPDLFSLYKKYKCDKVPMLLENFNPATLQNSIRYVRESYGSV